MRNFDLLRVTLDIEKRFRMDFMTIKQASENGASAQESTDIMHRRAN